MRWSNLLLLLLAVAACSRASDRNAAEAKPAHATTKGDHKASSQHSDDDWKPPLDGEYRAQLNALARKLATCGFARTHIAYHPEEKHDRFYWLDIDGKSATDSQLTCAAQAGEDAGQNLGFPKTLRARYDAADAQIRAAQIKEYVGKCSVHRLNECPDTNRLVWSLGFKRVLQAFSGKTKTDIRTIPASLLSDDMMETLGGPPNGVAKGRDGTYLFIACVAHMCEEKGAIVLNGDGTVVAEAMLVERFIHQDDPRWQNKLDKDSEYSRLDVFVRAPLSGNPRWHRAIADWAKEEHPDGPFAADTIPNLYLIENVWLVRPSSVKPQKLSSEKIEVSAK